MSRIRTHIRERDVKSVDESCPTNDVSRGVYRSAVHIADSEREAPRVRARRGNRCLFNGYDLRNPDAESVTGKLSPEHGVC